MSDFISSFIIFVISIIIIDFAFYVVETLAQAVKFKAKIRKIEFRRRF